MEQQNAGRKKAASVGGLWLDGGCGQALVILSISA